MIWAVLMVASWALTIWAWRIADKACAQFVELVEIHEALAASHDKLCETMEMMLEEGCEP